MRWLVEAADTKTGQETELTVEALTEADAERLARYNGLLVSRVSRAGGPPGPVVPYAVNATAVAPEPGPRVYPQLIRRARATDVLGIVLSTLGWLALALGLIGFAYHCFRGAWDDYRAWRGWLPAAVYHTWAIVLAGLIAITGGSVLRLLAEAARVFSTVARRPARSFTDDSLDTP